MQGAFCLQLIKKILTIISWTYIFKLSIIYVFIEFETLASLRNIMKMNIHHILLALGKRKRNSLHTCWTEPQTIMIFMKCSWVPYNLCLSTAILKGVNIFCILWLATNIISLKLIFINLKVWKEFLSFFAAVIVKWPPTAKTSDSGSEKKPCLTQTPQRTAHDTFFKKSAVS